MENSMNNLSKLESGLKELNLNSFPDNFLQNIEKYINEIILFNSAYNLTNTSDFDEIIVNHILDSLSAAFYIKEEADKFSEKARIADIGSGGGLPGIPLSLLLPQYDFTLVERMDKRCAFLENQAAILGLKNVKVLCSEAEKVAEESFDIVTFRAFRPLDKKMIKTLLRITKKGGIIAAYKAKKSSIEEEMNRIKSIVNSFDILPLQVPFLTNNENKSEARERNLVIIKKI